MGGLWSLMTVVGPILLGLAILWALLANRRRTPRDEAESEAGTRRLYERLDSEDRARDRDGA